MLQIPYSILKIILKIIVKTIQESQIDTFEKHDRDYSIRV